MQQRFLIALLMCCSFAVHGQFLNSREVGANLSYVIPSGDIADYFKSGFGYQLSGFQKLGLDPLGAYSAGISLNYYPLKSDDIRESSKLRLYALSCGLYQNFYESFWFQSSVFLSPEFMYWVVYHNLGSNYPSSDRGGFFALRSGLKLSFLVYKDFYIDALVATHAPSLNYKNALFEMGIGIAQAL